MGFYYCKYDGCILWIKWWCPGHTLYVLMRKWPYCEDIDMVNGGDTMVVYSGYSGSILSIQGANN